MREDTQNPSPENEGLASALPTAIPSAKLVLQRTQVAVNMVRGIMLEHSAEYWYECGRAAADGQRWAEAAHAYRQCIEREARHWRAAMQRAVALVHLGQAEAAAAALSEARKLDDGWSDTAELDITTWEFLRNCTDEASRKGLVEFQITNGWVIANIYFRKNNMHIKKIDESR